MNKKALFGSFLVSMILVVVGVSLKNSSDSKRDARHSARTYEGIHTYKGWSATMTPDLENRSVWTLSSNVEDHAFSAIFKCHEVVAGEVGSTTFTLSPPDANAPIAGPVTLKTTPSNDAETAAIHETKTSTEGRITTLLDSARINELIRASDRVELVYNVKRASYPTFDVHEYSALVDEAIALCP